MYQLIRTALRQPISIVVVVIGILFFSILSIRSIPVDIFPNLDLPTIYVVQPYGGMAPDQMDGFIATRYQDHFLYVSGIRDVDVKTIQGLSLIKLSFYPGTDMAQAAAEVANNVSRAKAYMPEGTVPPQVRRQLGTDRSDGVRKRVTIAERDPGLRVFPGASDVQPHRRRFQPAAIRWQPAHDRRTRRPGADQKLPFDARRGH